MTTSLERYTSPLRYPGGKAQLTNFVKMVILENGLVGSQYIEPYAGGASVALSLLFEDYVSSIHINDLNRGIHDFWHSVLYTSDSFCALVEEAPLTVHEWRGQREIAFSDRATVLERGFATFYLNRTNRSGIISGGIIGGLDQTGPWKMDARFPREELQRRILKVARFRSRITLTCEDTLQLLAATESNSLGRFYFLDPPYYGKGERLYDNFYNHEDHLQIHGATLGLADPWIVSYDAVPEIMSMYSDCRSVLYSMSYSANIRSMGAEVAFAAPGLDLPDASPLHISSRQVNNARLGALALPFA
jgi:DNA adenine methylase